MAALAKKYKLVLMYNMIKLHDAIAPGGVSDKVPELVKAGIWEYINHSVFTEYVKGIANYMCILF